MMSDWNYALVGGILIGIAVSLMLLWNGRVTGISGIIFGGFTPTKGDTAWRLLFVSGLILGGGLVRVINPHAFEGAISTGFGTTIVAGLLVGFGTVLGSGCTSGHGVCGISRWSPRSVVATVVFMLAGIVSVYAFRHLGVLP